jgi:hypothetical protein
MNAATTVVTIMAAKMAAERAAVVAALQKANAYTNSTALSREALPEISDDNLASLCKQGAVKQLENDRYYLDRAALQALKNKEAQAAKVALKIALALLMVAVGLVIFLLAKQ